MVSMTGTLTANIHLSATATQRARFRSQPGFEPYEHVYLQLGEPSFAIAGLIVASYLYLE